jgi:hypothetical protein
MSISRLPRQLARDPIHGNLTHEPTHETRTITILGKRIQVQHLIIAGTTVALGIGSFFLGENEHESNAQGSH